MAKQEIDDRAKNLFPIYAKPSWGEKLFSGAAAKAERLGTKVSRNEFIVSTMEAAADAEIKGAK